MRHQSAFHLMIAFAACAVFANNAHAYLKKNWTAKELAKESDAVVIAKPIKTVETKETKNLLKEYGIDVELVRLETTFKVTFVIKGDIECEKEFVVSHYKIKTSNEIAIENPPNLVEFRQESIIILKDKTKKVVLSPEYMMYLKVQKDGTYKPVAGDFEARDAIFEVNQPWSDPSSIQR